MDMANTIDKCSSHTVEEITAPSPNIQEVVDKVDKMDIVDTQNNISAVILKNQTSSLRNLLIYDSESSDNEEKNFKENVQLPVLSNSSSSSSDSESDSQECLESSEDDDKPVFVPPMHKKSHNEEVANKILEPIIDLSDVQINFSKEQFQHIGHIKNFIDALVTVESLTNIDSYNLETLLFIDNETSKKILGAINDVIGPVNQPVYCVQLRDAKEIEMLDLKEGMKVYSAPRSSYTKYVFLSELIRMKGTDASWLGDEELPSDEIDSSDDEFQSQQHGIRKRHHNNSLERHKQFEHTENRCNTIKNQMTNMFDKLRTKQNVKPINMFPHGFNPNIPPPNMQHNVHNNTPW